MTTKLERFSFISPDGNIIQFEDRTCQSTFGIMWRCQDSDHILNFGYAIQATPLPEHDGFVIVFPNFHKAPFTLPDNAAIYNADGTLRFHLKAPKPLARHLPGYIHTPQEVAELEPEGFWQVGWNVNDFGELCTWEAPYLMWAHIGLWRDVYERRYFDPATGLFDLEHYSTARR